MTERVAIDLPDRMDIASAEQLHLTLEGALSDGQPIQLNGDKVGKIDTSGVQLLLGLFREAGKQHLDVSWNQPSETILEAINFLNLTAEVGLNETAVMEA
jgi:ABC-type transporter Mla MlaB component